MINMIYQYVTRKRTSCGRRGIQRPGSHLSRHHGEWSDRHGIHVTYVELSICKQKLLLLLTALALKTQI